MAVNIHITIIELNALHTKRQNLFQELDAVIHLLMEAKRSEERFSRNAETDLVCRLLLEKKNTHTLPDSLLPRLRRHIGRGEQVWARSVHHLCLSAFRTWH